MIQIQKNLLAILGFMLFLIPLSLFLLWIHACNQAGGFPYNQMLYNSYFPPFLQGRFSVTLISLVLCVIAAILSSRVLKTATGFWQGISWTVVLAAGILAFLNLFSLM